ncbi:helix-turn-helix domain-containing protein [Chitinophaga sancti]|uniref:AraC-type DNA-binding protein n=1 Tax=Chitinophaga sancti TaxID=1004 RepID=A0A1K1SBL7_9BACT|nr:helix-turn-helix transcriptional regulator [Chitinophaga sancti]WQD63567.1 helix-turn-helix transcriptional regulator [Chitinophaga sancti]WQG90807.1 helix-turn-helix transcriptional regulator [Chitinophaga sancti]SFW81763.1 AraC-type DNA-binding protein [Chitinophaga sancti]
MSPDQIIKINTVEEFTEKFGFPSSGHPLLSVNRLAGVNYTLPPKQTTQFNLYSIVFKQGVKGTSLYGWREYDFSKGQMNFFAPGQIMQWDETVDHSRSSGWLLVFHPDFIRKYPLGNKITRLKYFSYETNEALHMSDAERLIIENIIEHIAGECSNNIDEHSQDIIVSQIDLLLNYADRFYKRQFRTRFSVESDIVFRFQSVLQMHFENEQRQLITVSDIAGELSMSTHYLSELLRNITGMSAQQHIHAFVIDKAKSLLLTTNLTISEVAYRLGFEYPGYFNRLFKNKTGQTPLEFRNMN